MSQLVNPGVKAAAATIAELLDRARVPNILFGWTAMSLVGDDAGFGEIEFVIPDAMMTSATAALEAGGDALCRDTSCFELRFDRLPSIELLGFLGLLDADAMLAAPHNRFHIVGSAHFHLPAGYILSLYSQSSLLWWLPDYDVGPPPPEDPNLVLSTDAARLPERGQKACAFPWNHSDEVAKLYAARIVYGCSGPWNHLYPVKVLSPRAFREAILTCLCRDYEDSKVTLWITMLAYLGEQREPGQTEVKQQLSEPFRHLWHHFHDYPHPTCEASIEDLVLELRDNLLAAGIFPGPT
ncbi:hypothetical protein BJX61DRAFT_539359 [Aspergillus egyptiacus]|nr:hypothetical protein BJX61DRAFT_539359 [Aspergillus egyptiacus]